MMVRVEAHAMGVEHGYFQPLVVREVFKHAAVVDVRLPDQRRCVVLCADCGATWAEGATYIPTCPPCSR